MYKRQIHYGYIVDQGETVDEVLVMLMRGPKSFTAEDTVEVNCHGGVYAMKRVLDVVLKNGARPAEPGEFTKRAFLNGRIDLSQACLLYTSKISLSGKKVTFVPVFSSSQVPITVSFSTALPRS